MTGNLLALRQKRKSGGLVIRQYQRAVEESCLVKTDTQTKCKNGDVDRNDECDADFQVGEGALHVVDLVAFIIP